MNNLWYLYILRYIWTSEFNDFGAGIVEIYSEYMHTAWLERWDGLISAQVTNNHIKPEPFGKGFMWLVVLRSAHLAVPTMHYAFSRTNIHQTAVKCIRESARWADGLTIRLVVKANSMSVRKLYPHTERIFKYINDREPMT